MKKKLKRLASICLCSFFFATSALNPIEYIEASVTHNYSESSSYILDLYDNNLGFYYQISNSKASLIAPEYDNASLTPSDLSLKSYINGAKLTKIEDYALAGLDGTNSITIPNTDFTM